jgi:hypothetical protein
MGAEEKVLWDGWVVRELCVVDGEGVGQMAYQSINMGAHRYGSRRVAVAGRGLEESHGEGGLRRIEAVDDGEAASADALGWEGGGGRRGGSVVG